MADFLLFMGAIGGFVKAHWWIFLLLFALANGMSFLLFGLDKRFAIRRQWRIPERHLLTVAACFGAVGAFLGMQIFRHKTKHVKFTVTVPLLLILQIAFLLLILLA